MKTTVGFCGSQGIRAFFADTAKDNKLREAACRKYVENRHANCSTRGKDNESKNHRFSSQKGPKIDPGGLFLASGGLLRAKLAPGGSQDRSGRPPKAKNKTFGAPKRRPRGAKSARNRFYRNSMPVRRGIPRFPGGAEASKKNKRRAARRNRKNYAPATAPCKN